MTCPGSCPPRAAATREIEAASMCAACGHLATNYAVCTIDGRPALSRPCPIGRHPDDRGRIRWPINSRIFEWLGVPKPIRATAAVRARISGIGANVSRLPLPGCGCSAVLVRLAAAIYGKSDDSA